MLLGVKDDDTTYKKQINTSDQGVGLADICNQIYCGHC